MGVDRNVSKHLSRPIPAKESLGAGKEVKNIQYTRGLSPEVVDSRSQRGDSKSPTVGENCLTI